MDYEKAYKEALERAKDLHDNHPYGEPPVWTTCEKIFPELKESEDVDKKIREEIITTIHLYYGKPLEDEAKEMIAWLEKQGEPVKINPTEFDTRLQSLIGKFNSLPKEELIGSLSFWLNVVKNDGTYKSDEKQGEFAENNKDDVDTDFTIYHPLKNGKGHYECIPYSFYGVLSSFSEDKDMIDFLHLCFYTEEECNEWIKQNESTDKVEPKFHEGDWVVDNNGKVAIIYDLQKAGYVGHYTNGTDFVCKYANEHLLHLWTIEDAKDGEVLCSGNPFIFRGFEDKRYPNNPTAYCGINSTDKFILSDRKSWWTANKVNPATKEQCELLFSKMKEAGYEWDAKKKELKKIEKSCYHNEGLMEMEIHKNAYHLNKRFNEDQKVYYVWYNSSLGQFLVIDHCYRENYDKYNIMFCASYEEAKAFALCMNSKLSFEIQERKLRLCQFETLSKEE